MTDSHADAREHAAHDRVSQWDAAYVLGALSAEDRRAFELHLESCERCADAVAALAGLPGLLRTVPAESALGLLDREEDGYARAEEVSDADLDSGTDAGSIPPPADLLERMQERERRRSGRTRRRLVLGLVAAAVVLAAVAVPSIIAATSSTGSTTVLAQTQPGPLEATVRLASADWGTSLDVACSYAEDGTWYAPPTDEGGWRYALVVIDDTGEETQVSTWKAAPGESVDVVGSTELSVDQIRTVEIRSLATGATLMTAEVARS
ncbi:anti-sigma factor family protein [Naasia lichenicola]|uniref:Zf-HC2 domain-containing protein n=1 Tax=Naasia lichenicola TaxID=2565933 RepID=A0A4S4FND3_9MICO|nr:zf-HC2 domain-containing protein [Naasia lichenicola]THG30995.1 zf-HC2 domain-containing protein [Naasia lichenicola]